MNHIKAKSFILGLITAIVIFVLVGAAPQPNPRFYEEDANTGAPLVGGKLYTYYPGTTTPKAAYTDKNLTTPHENPIVLDSRGQALIYPKGSTKYIQKTSDGVTLWTVDDVPGTTINVVQVEDYTSLAAAVTTWNAAGTGVRLECSSAITMTSSVTANSNIEFAPKPGCLLTMGAYNLTLNRLAPTGSFQWINKNSTGNVLINPGASILIIPNWWKENTVPGTTDMAAPFTACAASIVSDGTMTILPDDYLINTTVVIPSGISVKGAGYSSTYANATSYNLGTRILVGVTSGGTFSVTGTTLQGTGTTIEGINFTTAPALLSTPNSSAYGILLTNTFMVKLKDISFDRVNVSDAVKTAGQCNRTQVEGCSAVSIGDSTAALGAGFTYGSGFNLSASPDSIITGGTFTEQCGQTGMYIAANSKIIGGWSDLNYQGVYATGNRTQIIGSSIKYNKTHGVYLQDAPDAIISATKIYENNQANTAAGTNCAIRIGGTSPGVTITGCNITDDLSLAGHTVRQDNLNTGPAGNSMAVSGTTWGQSAGTVANTFLDSNSNLANSVWEGNIIKGTDPHQTITTTGSISPTVMGIKNLTVTPGGVGATITGFTAALPFVPFKVIFGDANTTVDFTGTSLYGNAGADWSPGVNDSMNVTYNGSIFICEISNN